MTSKRILAAAGCLVVATIVVVAGGRYLHSRNMALRFPRVAVGQDEASVLAIMGTPDRKVTPRPSHWCDAEPVAADQARDEDRACGKQWQYDEWPWPACYSVCFGSGKRVVSTYHYVSP
jgi:hypothetical protein